MLLTVTFYPLKMAKMVFLDTFRPNRLTKHNLGAERTFLVAKIFYIPLPQHISKPLGTLTQKVWKIPNPPLTAHCAMQCNAHCALCNALWANIGGQGGFRPFTN